MTRSRNIQWPWSYLLVTLAPYVFTRCNATRHTANSQPCAKLPLITPAGPDDSNDLNLNIPSGAINTSLVAPSLAEFIPMTVYKGRFTSNPTAIDDYLALDASLVAGLWDNEHTPIIPHTNRFEAILMFTLGDGLAQLDPYAAPQGSIKGFAKGTETGSWWRNLMPSGTFGQGGNDYNISPEQAEQYLQARMDAYAKGYGYATTVGSDSSGTILAIALVLVYVVFASFLFGVLVWRESFTSTSWASTTELTTLALGSEFPDESFDCTSAGIDTMGQLKQSVRVLPRNGRLQLVVTNGSADDHSLLLANEGY